MGLTLLSTASIPKTYWPYAFATAIYLINRLPTPILQDKSPYQILFDDKPHYDKLRVFGCLCFPWLRPYTHHKLEDKSLPCVFLGYSQTQSAYICLHRNTDRLYISRHVQFDENRFPFAVPPSSPSPQVTADTTSATAIITPIPLQAGTPCPAHHHPRQTPPPTSHRPRQNQVSHDNPSSSSPPLFQSEQIAQLNIGPSTQAQTQTTNTSLSQEPTAPLQNGPQPTAQLNNQSNTTQTQNTNPPPPPLPSPSHDIIPSTSQTIPNPLIPLTNTHPMTTRAKNNITKTKALTVSLADTLVREPSTVAQALKAKVWRAAMSFEFDAQTTNHTWDLVPHDPTKHIIGCKWIFTIKYRANGDIERYKARLVAKGYTQQYGVDYAETFSPVIKTTTIRTVLEIAVTKTWNIKQLDVNNAFLQGELTEEVYMSQPPGFIDNDRPTHICRLRKPIYGLKQAPRAWFQALRNHLLTNDFHNSLADTSLFIQQSGLSLTYVLIYVDDIIVTGNNNQALDIVLDALAARFSIKDPVDLHYFLGIEATRSSKGVHLMQRRYIIDLLAKTNMLDSKPVNTPLQHTPKLTLHGGTNLDDAKEYRSIVGSLQYLAFTRPDIAYAVTRLSQFMHKPTTEHWAAVKRLLRYLAGTTSHGIFLHTNSPLTLHAFSDADWAGDTDDYVSTNAYIIYLGSNPVSWSSKKQKGVARSSTEAEYRAVANTASEVQWLCSLLAELRIPLPTPPVIYCDNIGATYLCANPVFHSRMKHIALDYHFIRNLVQAGNLRISHVSTKDQLADTLTKPLTRSRFQETCYKLGVRPLPPS